MTNNSPATAPDAEDWDEWEGTTVPAGHALVKYQAGHVLVAVYAATAESGRAGEVVLSLDAEDADELAGVVRGAILSLGDEFAEDWDEWEGVSLKAGGHLLVRFEAGRVRVAGLETEQVAEAVLTLTAPQLEEFAEALEAAAGDPED